MANLALSENQFQNFSSSVLRVASWRKASKNLKESGNYKKTYEMLRIKIMLYSNWMLKYFSSVIGVKLGILC